MSAIWINGHMSDFTNSAVADAVVYAIIEKARSIVRSKGKYVGSTPPAALKENVP